jgi:predicted nucleotidyltransferase
MTNQDLLARDPLLAEIVRRLVQEFRPTRLYLFGSHARGTATVGSDYDLLVVVPPTVVPSYRLAQQAHRSALRGIFAPVDVVMITEQEFERKKSVVGTLAEVAVHEGKELYAA